MASAALGHNNPPSTPYEAIKAHIDDLYHEATNFLDGDPIETEAQAEAVSKILDDARKARTAAEAQRKIEAKPFDDGKAEVQALWTPLTDEKKGRCALIAETCKKALAPWLKKLEDEQRAKADAARIAAEEQAEAARQAAALAKPDDLAARAKVEAQQEEAAEAARAAARLDKERPLAAGGTRAIGLRSVFTPALVDPKEALRHYMQAQPDLLKEWLLEQARKDIRAGKRAIPGFEITEERVAQ